MREAERRVCRCLVSVEQVQAAVPEDRGVGPALLLAPTLQMSTCESHVGPAGTHPGQKGRWVELAAGHTVLRRGGGGRGAAPSSSFALPFVGAGETLELVGSFPGERSAVCQYNTALKDSME